jgi:acetyl-CoA synthetase
MRDSRQDDQPDAYAALHAQFGWQVDTHFNMAQVCCGRWAAAPDAARITRELLAA